MVIGTSPDKSSAQFIFDYLDRGQGFVVQIIHEGISSDDLTLRGSIKGAKAFVRIDPTTLLHKTKPDRTKEIIAHVLLLVVFVTITTFLFWVVLTQTGEWGLKVALGFFGVLFLSASLVGINETWKLFRLLAPKGLDIFYDDPRQGLIKRN